MNISIKNNLGVGQRMSGVLTIFTLLMAAPGFAQTLPYSEDFTTTTFRDDAATTADWIGSGQVLLPTSATLVDPFTATTTVEILPGNFLTRDVELADLDGDGDLDLIEATNTTNGVYLNDGTGFFGVARVYSSPISANTRDIVAGDVDRDGDIDFIAGNRSDRIRLYLNDGTGTSFVTQDVARQNRFTQSIKLVDLDGDGFLDVVAANLTFQQNYIYWNTGDPLIPFGVGGAAGTALDDSIREESRRVVTGDIDNDGDIDFVFMNESEVNPDTGLQQRNRVYLNLGNTRDFSHAEIEIAASDDIDVSYGGALGDLNGDGFLDLVVVNFVPGEVSKIYLNNASGTADANPFTIPATDFTVNGDPEFSQNARLADADNDGDLDIYLIISGHGFRNRVYFNDGTGTFTGFVDIGSSGQDGLATGTVGVVSNDGVLGDVDGDGDLDWVLGNQETQPVNGPLENILLRNNGTADPILTAQQLHAQAASLTVDNVSNVASVRLNPLPLHTDLGSQFHTSIDYWVTGNGGTNWSQIEADGRPVPIVAGNDVQWRAVMRANSPVNAATFAIDQLDIEENVNGPALDVPVAPDPVTVTEGVSVNGANIMPVFSDADMDVLYYSISGLPDSTGMRINPNSGRLEGTPNNEDSLAQPFTVTVTASDGAFSATDSYEIQVTNSNNAPNFTSLPPDLVIGPPATSGATQDVLYTYSITATDPDAGGTAGLTISATQLPGWLTLSATVDGAATLSGTPTAADVFDLNQAVALVVTDTGSATDTQSFAMAIANVDDDPVFTSTALTAATEGTEYSYTITVDDPDGDGVTITAPTLPAWLTLTDNGDGTATLIGTPVGADIGDHPVNIQAVDDSAAALTANQMFSIAVTAAADAPVITLNGNATVTIVEGNAYNDAGATASDAQDGDLTAAIVVDNPVNTGTPATYTVTYTVEDSAGNMATAQRTVVVSAAPPPPPPPRKSGGGSMGLVELLTFAMFGLLVIGLRRRRGMV